MGFLDLLKDGLVALHDEAMKNNPEYQYKAAMNPSSVEKIEKLRRDRRNEKMEEIMLRHCREEMEKNNNNPQPLCDLAKNFYYGLDVDEDRGKALYYYEQAAMRGSQSAMFTVAVMYMDGDGCDANFSKAKQYLKKIINYGNEEDVPEAMLKLGALYYFGDHTVPSNKDKALKWFKRAADKGEATAMHNLALMYYNGDGVSMDKKLGEKYYKKAREAGYIDDESDDY